VDQCDAAWNFGEADYVPMISDPSKIICKNKSSIAILDTKSSTLVDLPSPFKAFLQVKTAKVGETEYILFSGLSTTAPRQLVAYSIAEKKVTKVLQNTKSDPLPESYISVAQEIKFPTEHGYGYCYYYAPKNPEFRSEGLPPLRVLIHGGPTANCDGEFDRSFMYWTTRGVAIADINYGGSTGFGREYRNLLNKNWGVVDVDDCCAAALFLAEQGLVDREKLTIQGGSAGGFTTL
jgi:dipeptidyl aminopeptidase/acylaminoacyl peptidase